MGTIKRGDKNMQRYVLMFSASVLLSGCAMSRIGGAVVGPTYVSRELTFNERLIVGKPNRLIDGKVEVTLLKCNVIAQTVTLRIRPIQQRSGIVEAVHVGALLVHEAFPSPITVKTIESDSAEIVYYDSATEVR